TIDRSLSWGEAGQRLIPHVIPFAYGRPGFPPAPEAPPNLAFVAGYAGSLLLPLAACGVAARPRRRWPLLAIGVLGLLASASAPGVADLLAQVPPFDVAINERLAFAWAFAVAALAAFGAQAIADASAGLGARRLLIYSSLALAGFLALVLPRLGAALEPADLGRHVALYLAPLGLILWQAARLPTRWAAPLLLLALAAQRTGESGSIYPVLPRRSFYPEVAPLTALPRGGEPYRVVGSSYALIPNLSAMWELEDPRGYQALSLARLNATYPLWSLRLPAWFNIVPRLDRPFLSFLNVRYAVVGNTDPPPAGWSVEARLRGMQLLENERVLPRAFVPPRVRRGGSPRRVLREMAQETDFGQRAWIEAPGERPAPVRGHPNGPGRVRTGSEGSGYRLDVEMERRGWVVTSIAAWRGWRATAAGRDLPLAYANHAFVAFELPAGRHEVRLRYLPVSFVWGRAITFSTLGILTVAGVVAGVRRRRRPPSPAAAVE
ncbi:MAG TPA: YfhO family protein, partial [Thermoanaerobaculia bacterium]|nr:YfhO family protein [Thermoanaerobaculia bacterium]